MDLATLSEGVPIPLLRLIWPLNCTLHAGSKASVHGSVCTFAKTPGNLWILPGTRLRHLKGGRSQTVSRQPLALRNFYPWRIDPNMLNILHTIRLDYLSCILTV